MTPEQEDLLKMYIRMNAMQTAIAFYCCQKESAPGPHNPDASGEFYNPLDALRELMDLLMQIRDELLHAALNPGAGPI